jgi:hypothetical protein
MNSDSDAGRQLPPPPPDPPRPPDGMGRSVGPVVGAPLVQDAPVVVGDNPPLVLSLLVSLLW